MFSENCAKRRTQTQINAGLRKDDDHEGKG